MRDVRKAAIWYAKNGYSVIPVKPNKRPYLPWEPWQTRRADVEQVKAWWQKWPEAQVALVCGGVSGITVVDADSNSAYENLQENFIPDSMIIPTVKTSKGYHFYFKHADGLSNSVKFFDDCDLRNDGGYVLAPPSKNQKGSYSWMRGLKISNNTPPEMPSMLRDTIEQFGTNNANIIGSIPLGENSTITRSSQNPPLQSVTTVTNRNISFSQGGRDDTLFHLANHLVKSNMPEDEIRKYLYFIADNCSPEFPRREVDTKIASAMKRSGAAVENLTDKIRQFISVTNGDFSITEALQAVTNRNQPEIRNKIRAILYRMHKNDEIEKASGRDGIYRKRESDCEFENWLESSCEPVKLYLPIELTDKVHVSPGDIVLVSGSPNAGKTAFMLNVAVENRNLYDVAYFSSEMRKEKFKRRLSRMDVPLPDLAKKLKFASDWSYAPDVIQSGKGKLNVIDYLEVHDKFWEISKILYEIYERLDGAIAVVALQKDKNKEYGLGGMFTQQKPVLSISLDNHKARITKCKEFPDDQENPQGKVFNYKLVQGHKFMRQHMELGWGRE